MRANHWRNGFLIGVLLIVAFWLTSSIIGLGGKALVALSHSREARAQYDLLVERKAALEANLAALATERGKDTAIRTAFGVALPGEEVIVVVPSATTTPVVELLWWEKVLNWF